MEKKILQSICPGSPIRRIGCNGEDVSMAVMAKFIETQIRLLNNRHHPIVIVFDRERREATCDCLIKDLSAELDQRNVNVEYKIGIPDQTIENWILADYDLLASEYGAECGEQQFEGCFGKSKLVSILGADHSYGETTLGVEMFLKCDPTSMYRNSLSFRKLADLIDFECRRLQQIKPVQ